MECVIYKHASHNSFDCSCTYVILMNILCNMMFGHEIVFEKSQDTLHMLLSLVVKSRVFSN